MKRIIIGLTGGIGGGKSEVRRILENLGCLGIDADKISKEILNSGEEPANKVIQRFGNRILQNPSETEPQKQIINRSELAKIVFSNQRELSWLESLIYPILFERIDRTIEQNSDRSIVIEAIKLYDCCLNELCNQIWLVTAPEEIRAIRLSEKRHMTKEDALMRIRAQDQIDWHMDRANAVIDSQIPLEDMQIQVKKLWNSLMK